MHCVNELILVIDDNRTFPFGTVHARTSAEGLAALAGSNVFDEIWLDHDLGGSDTIWPVVDELIMRARDGRAYPASRVVVHSANPVGAARMMTALLPWYPVERISATTIRITRR